MVEVMTFIFLINAKVVSVHPATLPGEERIQIVIPFSTTNGTVSITTRKPSPVTSTLDDIENGGLFSSVSSLRRSVRLYECHAHRHH
jgi:type IV secretion system protein VirB11